ncbi:MAG: DUF3667 domain-containing protein [Bacteroidaceae bacterium]|nr:DUF3667 domain-containing protein [Bacteroidaceae bacterium]
MLKQRFLALSQRISAIQQKSPDAAPLSPAEHQCLCCSQPYTGNYCPRCGQSAATRRFSFRNILKTGFDVWGFSGWALPRTLWNLIYRPGYMIGNYLDGQRAPYLNPFKCLLVVVALYALATALYGDHIPAIESFHLDLSDTESKVDETAQQIVQHSADTISAWVNQLNALSQKHMAISLLLFHSFLALTTTFLFRHAPRRPNMHFAEHFIAQVYISCQMLLLSLPFLSFRETNDLFGAYCFPFPGITLLLFVYNYRQLYGYSWLRTFWKTILTNLIYILFIGFLSMFIFIGITIYEAMQIG